MFCKYISFPDNHQQNTTFFLQKHKTFLSTRGKSLFLCQVRRSRQHPQPPITHFSVKYLESITKSRTFVADKPRESYFI